MVTIKLILVVAGLIVLVASLLYLVTISAQVTAHLRQVEISLEGVAP